MPSPFPGMDPFLEGPDYFAGLRFGMSVYLSEVLNARLPEPYYADICERRWFIYSHDGDLHGERAENFVNVWIRPKDDEELVTTIEVLGTATKAPGEHARDLYLQKQREALNGRVHLVEIDLLRAGRHTTAVPLRDMLAKTGPLDYHVCIHHFNNAEDYFIYPILLPDRLPEIAVPLLPGDPPVNVDLQAVFDRSYDTGPYRRRVRYAEVVPPPSLPSGPQEWVDKLLQDKGLLPKPDSG